MLMRWFQFTHPGGVRLESRLRHVRGRGVSIHAPGRGATSSQALTSTSSRGFNSRTREGCDQSAVQASTDYIMFQFTHPGGVRRLKTYTIWSNIKFQFTHPGGVRRGGSRATTGDSAVSIHAPGRGATSSSILRTASSWFQFTHPGGVRRPRYLLYTFRGEFQFTHPGGVRLSLLMFFRLCVMFQFTHPGGVRRRMR